MYVPGMGQAIQDATRVLDSAIGRLVDDAGAPLETVTASAVIGSGMDAGSGARLLEQAGYPTAATSAQSASEGLRQLGNTAAFSFANVTGEATVSGTSVRPFLEQLQDASRQMLSAAG